MTKSLSNNGSSSPNTGGEKMIKLNIGGYRYCTSRTTLLATKATNFFHSLLSGELPTHRDEDQHYFIDRNGALFEPILDYLRTGVLIVPKGLKLVQILHEANFYLIDLSPAFCGDLKDGLYYSHSNTLNEILFLERDSKRPYLFAVTGNIRKREDDSGGQTILTFVRKVCKVKNGVLICDELRIFPDKASVRIWNPKCFKQDIKLSFYGGPEAACAEIPPDLRPWKMFGEAKGRSLYFSKAKSGSNTLSAQYNTQYIEKAGHYQVEILCSKFLLVRGKGKAPGTGFIYVQDAQKLWLYGSPILETRRWEYFTKEPE